MSLSNTFRELVEIDSPSGQEQAVAKYLEIWLTSQNFEYFKDDIGNILAFRSGSGEPLLLCAHMDVVDPCLGVKPSFINGVVKSDGTTVLGADNKASIAAIIKGVEDYLAQTGEPRAIEILFAVKEETGGGVEFMDFSKIKSKQGIIFDLIKPIGTIAIASPYIYNFHIKFTGKSSHASRPDEGKSALKPAAKLITSADDGFLDNGLTTINFGKIEAGTGINIIPETATIHGEVRSFKKDLFEAHLEAIEKMAKKCASEDGVKVDFTTDGRCAGYEFPEDDTFIKKISAVLAKNGHKIVFYKTSGISDSNPLVEAGIKVVTLGDGITKAHTVEEEISLESLESMRALVFDFLQKLD